jgi:hypothetical protein
VTVVETAVETEAVAVSEPAAEPDDAVARGAAEPVVVLWAA